MAHPGLSAAEARAAFDRGLFEELGRRCGATPDPATAVAVAEIARHLAGLLERADSGPLVDRIARGTVE